MDSPRLEDARRIFVELEKIFLIFFEILFDFFIVDCLDLLRCFVELKVYEGKDLVLEIMVVLSWIEFLGMCCRCCKKDFYLIVIVVVWIKDYRGWEFF